MRQFLEKNTTLFFHSALIALALLSGVGTLLGAGTLTVGYGLFSMGFLLFLTLWASFQTRGRILCGILCLTGLLGTFLLVGPANLLPFFREYYVWMFGTPTENMLWLRIYELFQICWITAGAFFYGRLAGRFSVLCYLAAGGGLGWVLWDMFYFRELPHLCVVCCLTYVLLTYVSLTEERWKKQRIKTDRSYLLRILPYLLVFALLLGLTPAPEKPYDWAIVKGAYESLRETWLTLTYNWNLGNHEDFDNAAVGFAEQGELSGSFWDDNQELMEIQISESGKTNLYLSGKVYDTFHGTRWTQEDTSTEDDRTLDALETLYAVWRFDKYNAYDYLHPTNLSIQYKRFRTGYLFAPLKTWSLTGGKTAYTSQGGNLVLQTRAGYGTAYTTFYLQMNLRNALFDELLKAPLSADEEVWSAVQRKYRKDKERYTLSDLETHREHIYQTYGTAPALSKEVEAYLEEITQGAVTDLDKLLAIEQALSQMTYTRSPGALPADITSETDFLEYFLLDSREGYCSYFATAFVLLARAEGLPARYVEGFCIPAKKEKLVTICGRDAHAWPEVYIEEIGWIPFEPTPGYGSIRYTPWRESIPGQITGVTPTPAPTPAPTPSPSPSPTAAPTPAPVSTQAPTTEEDSFGKPLLIILLVPVAFLFMFFVLKLERALAKRRYERSPLAKRFRLQVQKNLQLLGLLGYRRDAMETLQEFQVRVERGFVADTEASKDTTSTEIEPPEDDTTFVSDKASPVTFLTLYEAVLYGNAPVTPDMLLVVQSERAALLEILKNQNKPAYLWICLTGSQYTT